MFCHDCSSASDRTGETTGRRESEFLANPEVLYTVKVFGGRNFSGFSWNPHGFVWIQLQSTHNEFPSLVPTRAFFLVRFCRQYRKKREKKPGKEAAKFLITTQVMKLSVDWNTISVFVDFSRWKIWWVIYLKKTLMWMRIEKFNCNLMSIDSGNPDWN